MRRRLIASIWVVAIASASARAQVVNPGFEDADPASPVGAAGWKDTGNATKASREITHPRDGVASLRLLRTESTEKAFAGIGQSIDAAPWHGKTVRLKAYFRSEKVTHGSNGLWLRADDGARKSLAFAHTYDLSLKGDTDWTEREVLMDIPAEAQRIFFGAVNASDAAVWVDSFELAALLPSDVRSRSPEAAAYLDHALEVIRAHAYYAPAVDWDQVRLHARYLAQHALTTGETHAAIRYALSALHDHHSFLEPAEAARHDRENDKPDFEPARSRMLGDAAYIAIPGYGGLNTARSAAFTSQVRAHIDAAREAGACGWIVDLRDDIGGNMYPMLDGLAPLLGDGLLGYFVARGGRSAWYLQHGITRSGPLDVAPAPSAGPLEMPYVAVLTGPRTTSSGENVVVSFRGRANTRSFGAPTSGRSSANSAFALDDGARIILTVALDGDRDGHVFGGPIAPDVAVALPPAGTPLDDDAVVQAALGWLRAQPCHRLARR